MLVACILHVTSVSVASLRRVVCGLLHVSTCYAAFFTVAPCIVAVACISQRFIGACCIGPSVGAQPFESMYGGGVLRMKTGTAMFDTVAISDTRAYVRAGRAGEAMRVGPMRCGGGCRRTGCGADCKRCGCVGCAQHGGGVVSMAGGAVTFKGGSISNIRAVCAHLSRLARHVAICCMVCRALRHGR